MNAPAPHGVVLFDGVCTLCNGAVNFVIDRDPAGYFQFAALQSDAGAGLLRAHGREPEPGPPDSLLLLEDGRVYERSEAALRIARRLSGAWKLLYALRVVPRPLRDAVYRWVARHRYAWFGQRAVCRLPTPEEASRFL
jgi:predicted DCC family thiol-disulfide oxidoreductase YuxK